MITNPSSASHPFLDSHPPRTFGLLRSFLGWWGGELQALLGGLIGGRLKRIHWTGEEFTVPSGAPLKRPPSRALVVWPLDRVLRRTLTLPQAAEQNLDAAIRFELGRHLPFAADQAVYHYQIGPRDEVKGQTSVEVIVLRREDVKKAIHAAQIQGIGLTGLMAGTEMIKGSSHRRWSGVEKGLAAGLIAALAMAVYLPSRVYTQRLAALTTTEADLTRQLDAARAIAMGRQAPALILDGLAAERRARPSPVLLLDDLTNRLPDQSWVRFLTLDDTVLKLEGSSASAADIISQLESSDWISGAKFLSPTVTDPVTGLERYRITATVKPVWRDESGSGQ